MGRFGKKKSDKSGSVLGSQKGPQMYFRNLRLSEGQGKKVVSSSSSSLSSSSPSSPSSSSSSSSSGGGTVEFAAVKDHVARLAANAMVDAQDAIKKYGSKNKSNPRKEEAQLKAWKEQSKHDAEGAKRDQIAYDEWLMARRMLFAPLDMRPAPGTSMEGILRLADEVERAEVGNCGQLSALICKYLLQSEPDLAVDVVVLKSPGDHAFVVIGQDPDKKGNYPKSFSEWNEDAIIVDAWADILCPAREYPARWMEKMAEWAAEGTAITGLDHSSDRTGALTIVLPGPESVWYTAIIDHDKISVQFSKPKKS